MTAPCAPGSPARRAAGRATSRAAGRAAALAAGLLLALFACTLGHAPVSCRPGACTAGVQQAALAQLASATVVPAAVRQVALPAPWTLLPALLLLAPAPGLLARRRRDRQRLRTVRTAPRWQRGPPGPTAALLPA